MKLPGLVGILADECKCWPSKKFKVCELVEGRVGISC